MKDKDIRQSVKDSITWIEMFQTFKSEHIDIEMNVDHAAFIVCLLLHLRTVDKSEGGEGESLSALMEELSPWSDEVTGELCGQLMAKIMNMYGATHKDHVEFRNRLIELINKKTKR